MTSSIHDIDAVKATTGIAVRTLRHWIHLGVVPKPLGRGPAARYTDFHILRIRVAQILRAQGHALRAIRLRINPLDENALAALIPPPPAPPPLPSPPPTAVETTPEPPPPPVVPPAPADVSHPPAMPDYPHQVWHSLQLMRGLVLLVDTSEGEVLERIASDIFKHYSVRRDRV